MTQNNMKKIILLFAILIASHAAAYAQHLEAKKMPDLIAYNGQGKYGIIVIIAHNSFALTFSTSLDGPRGSQIIKQETRQIGIQTEYTLTFDAAKTKGATLRIEEPNHVLLTIPIGLSPNEAVKYLVDDPEYEDSKPCHRKHIILGDRFFAKSEYEMAKFEYENSLKCWPEDESDVEINNKISDTDKKIRELTMFDDENNVNNFAIPEKRSALLTRFRVISYEFEIDASIGLAFGIYKDKLGEYGSIRISPDVFSFLATKGKSRRSEYNLTGGVTYPLIKIDGKDRIWAYGGLGLTALDVTVEGALKTQFAVSPEIGAMLKIPVGGKDMIALKYTLQYRHSVKDSYSVYFGVIRSIVGIGFCF